MSSAASPGGTNPASPLAVPAQEQRRGLVVLGAAFVVLTMLAGGVRAANAPAAPAPAATRTPSPTPGAVVAPAASPTFTRGPSVPPEAKKTLWSTEQAASGQFLVNTYTAQPRVKATKTNEYRVLVESSLNYNPDGVARTVQFVLDDMRGWASYGKNNFRLVTTDAPDRLTFYLASPKTTDQLCGAAKTQGKWNCVVGNKLVMNSDRWFYQAPTIPSVDDYRIFMINHLAGTWLGQKPATCPGAGAKAPVMLDQSQGLGGCKPNVWPTTSG